MFGGSIEHMFLKALAVLGVLALVIAVAARPSGGAGTSRTYVVKPADTLWSIAVRTYAGDPREGVWQLERRNHLRNTTVTPGQRLVLP
jgi:LysM repeat protein